MAEQDVMYEDLVDAINDLRVDRVQRDGEYTLNQLARKIGCSVDNAVRYIERLRERGVNVTERPFQTRNGKIVQLYSIDSGNQIRLPSEHE